jgi:hypothetical protein
MEISGALIKDGLGVAESGVMGRTPFGANSEIPTEELNVLLSQAGSILFPFQPHWVATSCGRIESICSMCLMGAVQPQFLMFAARQSSVNPVQTPSWAYCAL